MNSKSNGSRSKSKPSDDVKKNGKEPKSPSKDRYGLRSNSDLKRMSWADMCEAADENSVSSPFKALTVATPIKEEEKKRTPKKEEEKKITPKKEGSPKKNPEEEEKKKKATPEKEGSKKKRERNPTETASPSLDGIKRRLGWSRARNVPDDVSTESSSICSSEDGLAGTRYETDPLILSRRQKQIDYGKNTKGYKLYLEAVPRVSRKSEHIFTPKKHVKYSRRSWDSQIKTWRKRLHQWDPRSDEEDNGEVDLSDMVGMI